LVQGLERVRNLDSRIRLVDLIEIDAIRSEAAEAILGRLEHIVRPCTATHLIDGHAELRGDDHFTPTAPERTSEELFAVRTAIDVRRIKEVDAGVESGMDDF